LAGYQGDGESLFTARRRHLTALSSAQQAVARGLDQLRTNHAGELLADELLSAQNFLNEITGEFSADDLLGEIFAGFCVGK
jgi:tRNA modification GTPase